MRKVSNCPRLSTLESKDIQSSPVQEAHVGEETVLILGVAELSKELLDILLGDLVSEIAEDVVKLSQHHGAVAARIIQSEASIQVT